MQLLKTLLLLFSFFAPALLQAQASLFEDSLLLILQTPGNSETKVDALTELAHFLRNDDTARANRYALEALEMATDLEYKKGLGDSHFRLGKMAELRGAFPEAENHYLQARDIRSQLGLVTGVAACYVNLGLLYQQWNNNYQKAAETFETGIAVLAGLETEDAQERKARLLSNLGDVRWKMRQSDQAVSAFEECIRIRKQLGDEAGIALTQINLATVYYEIDQFDNARKLLANSLDVFLRMDDKKSLGKVYLQLGNVEFYKKRFESAIPQYETGLQLDAFLDTVDKGRLLRNIGSCLVNLDRAGEAEDYYNKALPIFKDLGNQEELASLYFELGNIRFTREQYDSAVSLYMVSLEKLEKLTVPRLEAKVMLNLSKAFEEKGNNPEALRYLNRYLSLTDSLVRADQGAKDGLLMDIVEAVALKTNILDLSQEVEQKEAAVFKWTVGFSIAALLFIVAALIAYYFRSKRQIAEKNEEIAHQMVDELLLEKELAANYARLEGQETERERIAKELHDHIGGMLSVVKYNFTSLNERIDEVQRENREQFNKTAQLLDNTCDEVRKLAHELHSGFIAKFGLKAQLESYAEKLQTPDMEVELSTHGLKKRLPPKLEVHVFRIIQELVSNALKHAKASFLSIQVNRFENELNIMVEDDGVGFDLEKVALKSGMGLTNLRGRVNELEGSMDIDSEIGRGTIVTIKIPAIDSSENKPNIHD